MNRDRTYYVYIMTNRSKTLYIGVTGDIERRVRQHKQHVNAGFSTRYKIDRLVYYERFGYPNHAIRRETELKGWLRIRKIQLIVSKNPTWRDLSEDWGKPTKPLPIVK
jgi:putative endonuclease